MIYNNEKRKMAALLCLFVVLTGCSAANENHDESSVATELNTIIESTTQAETTAVPDTTESQKDEVVNWTELYYQSLRNTLIPKYGVYNASVDIVTSTYADKSYTPTNATLSMPTGIVGIEVTDFNHDEKPEIEKQ